MSTEIKPEISTMIDDVNYVLKKHLSSLLNPILHENEKTHHVLLNIPFIRKLYDENKKKDKIIKNLSEKLESFGKGSLKLEVSEVNNNISFIKSKIELNIENENKKITLNSLNYCSEDSNENSSEDSYNYTDECSDINISKFSSSPEISSILENLKKAKENYESPIEKQLNNFTLLENDEDKKKISIAKTVLLAQKAGEYATIDTDSEEDVSAETDRDLMIQSKEKMLQERMKLDEDADDDGLVSEKDEEDEEDEEEEAEDEEDEEEEEGEEDEEDEDDEDEKDEKDEAEEKDDEDEEDEEEEAEEKDDEDEEDEEEEEKDEEEKEDEDEKDEDDEDEKDEDEEDEEEAEEKDEEDEDDELEVEEVTIKGKKYLTDDTNNGYIYKCDNDGEMIFDKYDDFIIIGNFKGGKAIFI